MEWKLKEYIRDLFADAPKTDKIMDIERRAAQIASDKYRSIVESGGSEEEAYIAAVNEMGFVGELIEEVRRSDRMAGSDEDFNNPAYLMSIGVAGYILSLVPIVMAMVYNWSIGISLLSFLAIIAVATGLLIYGWSMRRERTGSQEGASPQNRDSRIKLRLTLSFALWAVIVTIYLAVSMVTHQWSITWLIFPIGLAVEAFLSIFFVVKKA